MRGGRVRLLRLVELEVQRLVDQLPARDVVPVDQRDRGARRARAAGAADAVQVGLLVLGALVVHDVRDALDVDAARGDVGADEDVDLAVSERAQRLLTRALAQVAVDGAGREAALGQLLGDVGGGPLGAAEDHRQVAALGLQDAGDHLDLVERVRAVDVLGDVRDRRALVVRLGGADVGRAVHVPAGEADDGARHGRREQHGLPLRRQLVDDLLDVGQEAQVEHLVGLVQHEHAHGGQVELLLARQVQQTARGADDDVDAALQRLDLGLVAATAVDRENPDVTDLAGDQQVVGDLGAQLARRDDDQRLRRGRQLGRGEAAGVHVGGDADGVDDGESEAQGLAGAGLGLPDDVVAGHGDREGHLLDREGSDDANGLEGLCGLGKDPEFTERSQGCASSGCGAADRGAAGVPVMGRTH